MKKLYAIVAAFSLAASVFAQRIDLSGQWRFAIDRNDEGVAQHWFDDRLPEVVNLPGSMLTNGKGDDVDVNTKWMGDIVDQSYYKAPEYARYRKPGNIKFPFWLKPDKYYAGAAWYQRDITIPADWKKCAVTLFMERCHWESRLWIDGKEMGMRNALSAPHQYDVTGRLTPGRHNITICVDNRIKTYNPGINSSSITDHTQGNWNGIVGAFYVEAKSLVHWEQVALFPNRGERKLTLRTHVRNQGKKHAKAAFSFTIDGNTTPAERMLAEGDNELTFEVPLPDSMQCWDEFHPNLYRLDVAVSSRHSTDNRSITFGCRDWSVRDTTLFLNGHPAFVRGTLHCAAFPLTGYPSTDKQEWLREFAIIKSYGLNQVRFHSWCPPEAAFEAADELGLYLSVECSSWANDGRYEGVDNALSPNLGYGHPIDDFIYRESNDIVAAYGNHPSFCFMSYGNEPGGKNYKAFLKSFVNYWKQRDGRRLYTSAAGWPNLDEADYDNDPNPRIQRWGEGLGSIINAKAPSTAYDWKGYTSHLSNPCISHEIGQWCVYPDFKEMGQYTGVYKPRNFEIFKETLSEHGMASLADSFLLASGKLQTICYKADVEAALRTRNFGGFQLLGLNDFPGQGTALVGALNVFWGEKGYVSAPQYRHFCDALVPLARMQRLLYENCDTLRASVEVANYKEPLNKPSVLWRITDSHGAEAAHGSFSVDHIPLGNCICLGTLTLPLSGIVESSQMNLEVTVDGHSNDWNFWVYPSNKQLSPSAPAIVLTDSLDAKVQKVLACGGKVILSLRKGMLAKDFGGDIAVGFSSIFWNTLWTNGQPPHTLGILCDPSHPALAGFPTSYHSDYQWWDAMSHASAINIGRLRTAVSPIVRVIDDWFTNRPLALLFAVRVGKGSLMVSGIDFNGDLTNRPAARQLLWSIRTYMASPAFHPATQMTVDEVSQLFSK